MRATKESNDFTSGEIIGRLPNMRAVRDSYFMAEIEKKTGVLKRL
jgi:hypothetical protein